MAANKKDFIEKDRYLIFYSLRGRGRSNSRSRYLVLWLLETLTGQQKLYGTGLLTQKERFYHSLSVLSKAGCIGGFV